MAFQSNLLAVAPPTEQVREKVADDSTLRRLSQAEGEHPGVRQRIWGLAARSDSTVTFEEFRYWAKIEREMEEEEYRRFLASNPHKGKGFMGMVKSYFTSNAYEDAKKHERPEMIQDTPSQSSVEKVHEPLDSEGHVQGVGPSELKPFDAEWRQAARALRTASWGSIFFLVTTDILGWSGTPYTFSSVGYGLGVGIFLIMGIAAACSGLMIWRTYLGLDSSRYPMLSFGDPFLRLYGKKTRHFVNVLQAFQQFCSVSVIILGNAQIISQVNGGTLCFIVCLIITMVIGIVSGYIRALKHLGWLCNLAVWMNITSFIIICVAAAKYPVYYGYAVAATNLRLYPGYEKLAAMFQKGIHVPDSAWPAPKTFGGIPPKHFQNTGSNLFASEFGGIDSMVYAFSGAILFVAFLSEMRRPMDFWKGMLLAQTFICCVYIFFGAFVYSFYGQYSYSLINQVINPENLRTAGNILSLVTAYLAIFLYFNVGFKTVYLEVGQELLHFPPYSSKQGRVYWYLLGPVYWAGAFAFAASVPYFFAFVNFIGGLFSLNFTYSVPGFMYAAYKIQDGATLPGEGFDPATGISTRHDHGMKRYIRGLKKTWHISIPVILFTMAGLAASGMGTWSGVLGLIASAKGEPLQTSWTCKT